MLGSDPQRYYWRSSVNLEENTMIILPIEHKGQEKGDTSNRLLFNLTTSLCHRIAIHMPKDHTHGASCESGRFTLWSGIWVSIQQEKVTISKFWIAMPLTLMYSGFTRFPSRYEISTTSANFWRSLLSSTSSAINQRPFLMHMRKNRHISISI
jgi:hypothetical protein